MKRILSGLLAVFMLYTTAFAANDAAAPDGQQSAAPVLAFAVSLPEDYDEGKWEQTAADLQAVLEGRLAQLGLEGAAVAAGGDRKTVTVTLPEGAETEGVAEFLAMTNALSITAADDAAALTGADVTAAEAGLENEAAYLQLTLSDDAQQALAALEADAALTVTLDGEVVGEKAVYHADDGLLTLSGGFDLDGAKLLSARVIAGELPAALTPQQPEPTEPTDPTEPTEPMDPAEPTEPAEPVFPDMAGHWAEQQLKMGVQMGLIKGIGGKIMPDSPVKRSEAITMLNRALGTAAEAEDLSGLTAVPEKAWYRAELAKGLHIGLIEAEDGRNFDAPATRAEAFVLFARAFGYDRAPTERDSFSVFTDTAAMTAEQRRAASELVAAGIVKGDTATKLAPAAPLTRAQFVTMLTRIACNTLDEGEYTPETAGGTLLRAPKNTIKETAPDGDLIFACPAENAVLDGVTQTGRVVLKGMEDMTLTAKNETSMGVLAADPAGDAEIALQSSSQAETLLIAGTGGKVSFSGKAGQIEITSTGREIDLTGMEAETLTITGSGNTILMNGKANTVQIAGSARNTTLTLNRQTETLVVAGIGSTVKGRGRAEQVDIRALDCKVTVPAASKLENIDAGLAGVGIRFGVPDRVLPGGSLNTQVTFTGVEEEKIVRAEWYQDGKPIPGCANAQFSLTSDRVSKHTSYFTFTKDMKLSVTMGFKLTYENPSTGETEEVYEEVTVPIENHSDEWYYQRDVNRVLNLVSSTYRGNYTTAYAVQNDYKPYEKEVWVNAKGYSSRSKYLLWINRAYQHVNVFTGSKGNWKLDRSYLVGTGAMSTPTPTGVTTVTYKLAAGWTTSAYTVRPVVGFYPNSGYAFHSRLCYPGTDKEYDFSGGYPISHGCIRMNKADVQWIYDTVPIGTTVVIF